MNPALSQLLHHPWLWRGDDLACVASTLPTGYEALDRELPGGGWPRGQLIELLADDQGIGELRLLLPVLRALVRSGGWVAMVAPPHTPYAPAFARAGIDPRRIVVIETSEREDRQHWWATEQVLRANTAAALLFWPRRVPDARLRRLHLAAQEGDAPAFLISDLARARQTSPSPLRIRLAAADATTATHATLSLDIFKRRGGIMREPLELVLAFDSFAAKPVESPSPEPAVSAAALHPLESAPQAPAAAIVTAPIGRLASVPLRRPPSFLRRHAVDAPPARIWQRAMARADEVRRVPRPDPRSGDPALFTSPSRSGRPPVDPARECH